MATDARGNFYEGAAGKRELGKDQPMTAGLGVRDLLDHQGGGRRPASMQLVEEGKIKLTDPAKALRAGDRRTAGARGLRRRRPAKDAPAEARHHRQRPDAAHVGAVLRVLQRRRPAVPHRAEHPDRRLVQLRVDPHRAAARPGRALDLRRQHRLARPHRRAAARQAPRRGDEGAPLRAARHDARSASR